MARPHPRPDRPRHAGLRPLSGSERRGRAARLRRGGLRLHRPEARPGRRHVPGRFREQAAARLLALHPGRAHRRRERVDPPAHADPLRPGHDRPGLVARPPAPRAGRGVPGGLPLCAPEHRPLPLWQRGEHGAFHQPVRRRIAGGDGPGRFESRSTLAGAGRGVGGAGEPGQAGRGAAWAGLRGRAGAGRSSRFHGEIPGATARLEGGGSGRAGDGLPGHVSPRGRGYCGSRGRGLRRSRIS